MADQLDLWERPEVSGSGAASRKQLFTFSDTVAAPVLVVEDQGGTVRLHVEGAPAPKYGPGKGRKPRGR